MSNAVEEIKDRMAIEDLVGQYVQLKKVGRSLKGLCPFHNEKTPSFIVSPEKQIAYCFGCNKGGDVFSFIQDIEGVDFVDAMKILAERTGVSLDGYRIETKHTPGKKEELMKLYEKVTIFYEQQLWQTEKGKKVIEYLHKRGINDETIKEFRLGFSPDSFETTYSNLLKSGFTKKTLVEAGIAQTKETTVEKIYDRFRGRLMFPICDSLGRVVGFGGRALSKGQEPKYLNSPETAIYHKSRILYGFSHAKSALKESEEIVIVEGYMDVLAAYQDGVKNIVASSGTALTSKQLRLLKPFVKKLYLAFDMDLAGEEAARRAFELSQEFDFDVYTVVLPEGKDPADFVKASGGKLAEVIKASPAFGEYLYNKIFSAYGTDTIAAKKKIIQELIPFIKQLRSNIEKDEYIRKLSHDLDLKEVQVYDEIKNIKLPNYHPARLHSAIDESTDKKKKYSVEQLILGFLIEFTRVTKSYIKDLKEEYFSDEFNPIYKVFVDQYNYDGLDSSENILGLLPHNIKERAALLSLYVTEKYGEMSEESVEKEMVALVKSVKKSYRSSKAREIQKKIDEAEKAGDREKRKKLLEELKEMHSY